METVFTGNVCFTSSEEKWIVCIVDKEGLKVEKSSTAFSYTCSAHIRRLGVNSGKRQGLRHKKKTWMNEWKPQTWGVGGGMLATSGSVCDSYLKIKSCLVYWDCVTTYLGCEAVLNNICYWCNWYSILYTVCIILRIRVVNVNVNFTNMAARLSDSVLGKI